MNVASHVSRRSSSGNSRWRWDDDNHPRQLATIPEPLIVKLERIFDAAIEIFGSNAPVISIALSEYLPKHPHMAGIFLSTKGGHQQKSPLQLEVNFGDGKRYVHAPRFVLRLLGLRPSEKDAILRKGGGSLAAVGDMIAAKCDITSPQLNIASAVPMPAPAAGKTASFQTPVGPSPDEAEPVLVEMTRPELQMAVIRTISVAHGLWGKTPIDVEKLFSTLTGAPAPIKQAGQVIAAMKSWGFLKQNGVGCYLSDEAMRFCYEEGDPPQT